MPKNDISLRVWSPLHSQNQIFLSMPFSLVFKLIMYMKFQNILMTGYRDMDKNIKNAPKMGYFQHCDLPRVFFQKSDSVTFVPILWCTNFTQKLEKTNIRSPRYFGRTNGRHGWLHRTPLFKPRSEIIKC